MTKHPGTIGLEYAIEESTDLGVSDDWMEVTSGFYVNNETTISYTFVQGCLARNFLRLRILSN